MGAVVGLMMIADDTGLNGSYRWLDEGSVAVAVAVAIAVAAGAVAIVFAFAVADTVAAADGVLCMFVRLSLVHCLFFGFI